MFARTIALRIGCGFRYMHRLAQYWRISSSNKSWQCADFERKVSTCFASVNLNLRTEGLQHTAFWAFSTMSSGHARSHSLDNMLKEHDDVNALFQTLAVNFPVKHLDPFEAVDCLKSIRTFMYNKMLFKMAEFQSQPPIITFAKVFKYQKEPEILMSVFQNPYFQGLLNQIQGCISQFTPANNAELFSCLVTLGISVEHSVMQKLISLFHDEKYPMCLNDLAMIFDHVKVTSLRWDLFFLRVCMPRLQKGYETNLFVENTSFNLTSLATLLTLFNLIQCSKMRDWYSKRLLSMAEDDSCMNLDSVRLIFIMLYVCWKSFPLSCVMQLTNLCFKQTEKRLHELKPYQMEVTAKVGWHLVVYKLKVTTQALPILERVHFLALTMLQKVPVSATLSEIVMILPGVIGNMINNRERKQLEALVIEHLEEANVHDLVELVYFTQIHHIKNETYHSILDAKIYENMDRIMDVSSAFMRISNYCSLFSTSLPLYKTVMHHMQKMQMIFETNKFVYLAQMTMCTFCEDQPFPKFIIDKIEAMISQFRLYQITTLLQSLDGLNRNRHTHAQILDLHILLEKAFVQKIKTTKLEELCDVTYKLASLVHSKFRHAEKFNLLDERMAELTPFMTADEFNLFAMNIHRTKLYRKVVLDSLTQCLVRHNEAMMNKAFVMLVVWIAKSGYQLQEYSVFTKLCLEMTQKHFDKMDIQEQIFLAYGLCLLQICPQEILCQIFSFEYLMLLDKCRAQTNLLSGSIIMLLNRCAVLEYPHLNIPWLHKGFKYNFNQSFFVLSRYFPDLPEALSRALGGPGFFQMNVLTQYFNQIYVELFLDENKRPVYYVKAKQADARNAPHHPIAILITAQLCTKLNEDDKQLSGHLQMEIRQLEILGYKVVVIHYSKWNSMAMFDKDERVKYLQEKLFTI